MLNKMGHLLLLKGHKPRLLKEPPLQKLNTVMEILLLLSTAVAEALALLGQLVLKVLKVTQVRQAQLALLVLLVLLVQKETMVDMEELVLKVLKDLQAPLGPKALQGL